MSDNIKYWIETSLYDLEVAASLLKKKHYTYVAFMCHQSVEKMLKAIYVKKQNSFPPKIHNLLRLTEMTDIRQALTHEQLIFLAELDPINIEARYPSYKENIRNALTKKEAKKILIQSKEFAGWLESRLK